MPTFWGTGGKSHCFASQINVNVAEIRAGIVGHLDMKLISFIIILFIYFLGLIVVFLALSALKIPSIFGGMNYIEHRKSAIMNMFENSCCLSTHIDEKRTNVWIIIYIHRESNWEIRQPVRYIHGCTAYRCGYIAVYFVYYVEDGFFFLNYIYFFFWGNSKMKTSEKIYICRRIPTFGWHLDIWIWTWIPRTNVWR